MTTHSVPVVSVSSERESLHSRKRTWTVTVVRAGSSFEVASGLSPGDAEFLAASLRGAIADAYMAGASDATASLS